MPTNTLFVAGEQRDAKRTRVNGSAMSVVFRLIRGYGGPTVVLQVVLHQMMVLRGGVAAILKGKGGKNGYYPSYPEVPRDGGFFVPPRKQGEIQEWLETLDRHDNRVGGRLSGPLVHNARRIELTAESLRRVAAGGIGTLLQ